MKKTADKLKVGDKILLAGEELVIVKVEISDVSKQGTKKCRLELEKSNKEKVVVIRPIDYSFEIK